MYGTLWNERREIDRIPRSPRMRKPILQFLAGFPIEEEVHTGEIAEHVRVYFNLSEKAASQPTPSTRDRTSQFRRNCGGALSGLKQDGSIERTCRDHYRITEKGLKSLAGDAPAPRIPSGDPKKHKSDLYLNQGGKCVICNGRFGYDDMEVDHIIPRARAGSDIFENLQLLCRQCNRRKGSKPQSEAIGIIRR